MVAGLLTFLRGLQSKGLLLAISAGLIALTLARTFTAGKASAKLDQAEATIKETKRNAEIAATIDSLSAAERRKRLLNDWSSR